MRDAALADGRWRLPEIAFWVAPIAAFFLFPGYLVLGSQVFITALFALSLDLILGHAGILSLGHAAFFGLGAYTAGLLAQHGWGEPLSGLAAAGAVAAVAGFASSFLVVRGGGLTQLMVTLGIGQLVLEAANKAASITGGVDGLNDVTMWKLLGLFSFDLEGRVAYAYSLAVIFACFLVTRRVVASPFGLSLRGIREQSARMWALGTPVHARRVAVFTLAAALAGVAGGLLAQTTQFVGLDSLDFNRSAEVLIILVLGGPGRLYGGLIGAPLFLLAQSLLSGRDPAYWQFWLGLMLVVVVLLAHGGVLGGADRLRAMLGLRFGWLPSLARANRIDPEAPAPRGHTVRPAAGGTALRTENLSKSFGGFAANAAVSLSLPVGARHALIGPNGAGKTTLINLLTGVLQPDSGEVFVGGERVTHLAQHERVRRGMTRTWQITTLFPELTPLESVLLAICEREGRAARWWHPLASLGAETREARALLSSLHLEAEASRPTRLLPYGKQRLLEIALALATRPRILLLDEPAAGIPANESAEVLGAIARLPADVTVLFIEHDMRLVFRFARRISVLVAGRLVAEGTPEEIARDPRVREVYLGEAQHG
ncbi:MAG TPA: ATP-binding cassette domain-containing protein [Myxococcales bacterium]|nr:ATP-binding cassette domain-containing protein [Myxococcales bacterium]